MNMVGAITVTYIVKYKLHRESFSCIIIYSLTEWEGRMGKYLAQGYDVWTECNKVHAP